MNLTKQLLKHSLPDWDPDAPPLYDIHKTYLENLYHGPVFDQPIPERIFPSEHEWVDFLGHKVASRVGVPAGPLLSSQWTSLAAELGFDIVTYKTIRTRLYPSHPLPNMLYVDMDPSRPIAIKRDFPQKSLCDLAVTNSFGMPSMCQEFLLEDLANANDHLAPGQVLVVSFVGTPVEGEDFFKDFVEGAVFCKDAGAKILEANFSCPNVVSKEGSLYMSADSVFTLGKKIKSAVKSTPLIIKVGLFPDKESMRKVFIAAAKAGVDAISGINTISMQVLNRDGSLALGKGRATSGICGGPIRSAALDFIKNARAIIKEEKLALTLIGVGGITLPEHFDEFLQAGADFTQTATGMMWDPYLGMRYHLQHSRT
jgi:dihydroorotate dehydrogenase (NAD+) catalytic subunit